MKIIILLLASIISTDCLATLLLSTSGDAYYCKQYEKENLSLSGEIKKFEIVKGRCVLDLEVKNILKAFDWEVSNIIRVNGVPYSNCGDSVLGKSVSLILKNDESKKNEFLHIPHTKKTMILSTPILVKCHNRSKDKRKKALELEKRGIRKSRH